MTNGSVMDPTALTPAQCQGCRARAPRGAQGGAQAPCQVDRQHKRQPRRASTTKARKTFCNFPPRRHVLANPSAFAIVGGFGPCTCVQVDRGAELPQAPRPQSKTQRAKSDLQPRLADSTGSAPCPCSLAKLCLGTETKSRTSTC